MIEYTTDEVQQIASLRIAIHNMEQEIIFLTGLATQLATDDVEFDLTVDLHNKTTCAKNKGRYRISTLTENNLFGVVRSYANNHEKCRTTVSFHMEETSALRIINMLLQQKKEQYDALEKQLKSVLKINYTPIQLLNDGHIRSSH